MSRADEFDDEQDTAVGTKVGWQYTTTALADMTTEECAVVLAGPTPTVLLPLGPLGPRGPHLPLGAGALVAEECARRAARELRRVGVSAVLGPTLNFGVTRLATGFAGAISLSPAALEHLVRELCWSFRSDGFALVCVVDASHEPEHLAAVGRAVDGTRAAAGGAVYVHPHLPKYAAQMTDEVRRGMAHGGAFDTSLTMAVKPGAVREQVQSRLPAVPVSVTDSLRAGRGTFTEMGLRRAYAGAPAQGNADDGEALLVRLCGIVVGEVRAALAGG